MSQRADSMTARDGLVALVQFAGTVLFVSMLPHDLGNSDEAYFLYEAKRIHDGEILYRDIFQFITPIAPHTMAALFWLFGTTMATARNTTAVLHGVIVIAAYLSARSLRVAVPLAAVAAAAHIALDLPAWAYASWHWFSTACATLIMLVLLHDRGAPSLRGAVGLGALCGVLIGIQQQRGFVPTAAVGAWLFADALIDRWYNRGRRGLGGGFARLSAFAAGVLLVVVPMLLIFVVLAGAGSVYDALVRSAIENYRSGFRTAWGSTSPLTAWVKGDTFPRVLRFLPLALVVPALWFAVDLVRRKQREQMRQIGALTAYAAAGIASIWYYPDVIHIAYIAVPLLVCAALSLQWLLDRLPLPALAARAGAWALAVLIATGIATHLTTWWAAKWALYSHPYETAFGRIDYMSKWELVLIDATRKQLQNSTSQEIFCYPTSAGPYLTTGGKNPTPFQFLDARVLPARTAAAIETVRERRVPFLVISYVYLRPDDPVGALMQAEYEAVPIPELPLTGEFPTTLLYRRKADADQHHP